MAKKAGKRIAKDTRVKVKCPNCHTHFMREPFEIEQGEKCGNCLKDVKLKIV